jgi:hypothetical protein
MMVDYSEAFLEMKKNLLLAYEFMLKNEPKEAAQLLTKNADISSLTAAWIENENN